MAEEVIKQVGPEELFQLIQDAGPGGIPYSKIAFQLTGKENLPRVIADKSFKPALMTLKKSGQIEKQGGNWTVVNPESKEAPKAGSRKTVELPAHIQGVLLQPEGRGKLAPLLVPALHPIVLESKPIKFQNAIAWIGPTKDISSRQWTPLGELRGSRILLSDSAPDFTALPYSTVYIKVFVADKAGCDEGTYYIGELPEGWLAWVGQI